MRAVSLKTAPQLIKLELDTIKEIWRKGSAAPSDTMNFGITGGAISENCKLGTITVYITPNDNSNYIFTEVELNEADCKKRTMKKDCFLTSEKGRKQSFFGIILCTVLYVSNFIIQDQLYFSPISLRCFICFFARIGKKNRQPLPTT